MQIALGQSVFSSNNQKIGTVDRVLVNPVGNHVAHIVVHRGIFLDDDKVVARDAIERVDSAGVHLSLDADAVNQLPRFEHSFASGTMESGYPEVIPGPFQSMILFSTPPPGKTYLDQGRLFQLEPLEGTDERPDRGVIANDVVIGKGADVIGSDGHRIGHVHEVAYGAGGTLESVVVQTGLLRHHQFTIRAGQIAEIGDEEIVLNVPAGSLASSE
jgi:uncharacterized protein YrrD